MDPLRFAIAMIPLGAYLLLLGVVNARRRPLLTTGAADLATLGAALTGLVAIGPIELFRFTDSTVELGNFVWLLLLSLYGLVVALVVLVGRPRLVVFNASVEELRPVLAEAVGQLDPEARWAGDNLCLPRLGVQLHLDEFGLMRHVSLVSSGGRQSLDGWRRLRRALGRSIPALSVRPNPRAVSFFMAAAALLGGSFWWLVRNPMEVARAASEIMAF